MTPPARGAGPRRVLVTGANGFVGTAVVERLAGDGVAVRAAVRRDAPVPGAQETAVTGDLGAPGAHPPPLDGVDAIVHCAARVHVLREAAADPLAAFRAVNVEGTVRLARAAATAGVRRFVFVSSIGVNGAETQPGRPFTAADAPAPHTPYARSKLEAEQALAEVARETGLEVAIVRPPLVYGPNAPGNFATLVRAVRRGLPLPLASVRNRRSFIALTNLADLLARCTAHPAAAGATLLASDGEDLSTPELIHRIARALGVRPRLVPLPPGWLRTAARLAGRAALGQQLCGSLEIDGTVTRGTLQWMPPVSVDEELARVASALRGDAASARATKAAPQP